MTHHQRRWHVRGPSNLDLSTARSAPGPADREEVEQAGPPSDDLLFEAPWEQPAPGGPSWAGKAADLAANPSEPLEHAGNGSPWRPNGAVVLAVGGPYFHDGTVAEGRYEGDLEPTLLGALGAVQTLARAIFTQVGAPPEAEMSARCQRWALLFGPEQGQAQVVESR